MDKVITLGMFICLSGGAVLGGVSDSIADWRYQEIVKDPALYSLVDQFGQPMSQCVK